MDDESSVDSEASVEACRICTSDDNSRSPLIYPCRCTAPVHAACLQKWVETRPQAPPAEGRRGAAPMTCEVCAAPYRVAWRRELVCDRAHACSCRAWCHCVEALRHVGITCALVWVTFVVLPASWREERREGQKQDRNEAVVFYGLFAVAVLMVCVTLRRTFERWRAASSSLVLAPRAGAHARARCPAARSAAGRGARSAARGRGTASGAPSADDDIELGARAADAAVLTGPAEAQAEAAEAVRALL